MVILLTILLVPTAAPNTEDEKLKTLFKTHLDEEFKHHPAFATAMGNRDYDDRLDDLSVKARTKDKARLKATIAQLAGQINIQQLSADARIDFEIWKQALRYRDWQYQHDDRFVYDPRIYGEYITDSVYALFTQSTLPRERNVANAAKRITYIPRIIAAAKESLVNPPRELTEVAIKRIRGAIAFFEKDIYALSQESPATSELREPCQMAVQALKSYQQFLETDLLARSHGSWRLGKEKFAEKLELELNAGISADEVIREADAEAARVEQEMYTIAKQIWFRSFPGRPLPPDDDAGRRAVVAAVLAKIGENHGTAETFTRDTRKTVEKIKAFIRTERILTLPEPDRCAIIEMPEFQRGYSAAYLNNAPPLDPKAASFYAVSPPPSDWPATRQKAYFQEYNHDMLQVLTIHEAYPGHYVQLEYANRNPSLIRKILASGVFIEGWAVYTEQMMLDQGYGNGDLNLRMQQLKFYLRAILNAILDHRMHCDNMSDDDAVKLLVERGHQTEGEAVAKVLRCKQQSCQLSTYFVGRMAFYKLRQRVQRAHGEHFNLAKYHEAVLSHGSIPVKFLPELVK